MIRAPHDDVSCAPPCPWFDVDARKKARAARANRWKRNGLERARLAHERRVAIDAALAVPNEGRVRPDKSIGLTLEERRAMARMLELRAVPLGRDATRQDRRLRTLVLRNSGYSFARIGKDLGISATSARRLFILTDWERRRRRPWTQSPFPDGVHLR